MRSPVFILPALILILTPTAPTLASNQTGGLPTVHLFEDYREASEFFLHMGSNERIVISRNLSSTGDQLEELGFPVEIGPRGVMPGEVDPHDLAYFLLYLKERGITKADFGSLREKSNHIFEELSSRESESTVLFYSSDGPEYSLLAAYTAFLREAKLIDLDFVQSSRELLKGSEYVILVTKPLTAENYERYLNIVDTLISLDDDPYLDASLGILTGPDVTAPFLMLLASDTAFKRLRGLSLVEDLPLARKVEFIASSHGLSARILHPDVKHSNLTGKESIRVLKEARKGIIYLNLHGNPYVMALRTEGDVILTPTIVRSSRPLGTIVITLSCDTLRFDELDDPRGSIAYSFLEAGAFAYIGATKVEFSIGSEAGTSYPDLILMMALTGRTLGEAVMTVNNLHIKESSEMGISPSEAAYEVLLGDPTLSLSAHRVPYEVERSDRAYRVDILKTTPVLYLQLPDGKDFLPDVEADLPSVYFKWYSDERGMFVYVSTLSSSFSGYFREGMSVRIELKTRHGYLEYVPYVAIMLLTALSLTALVRARRVT